MLVNTCIEAQGYPRYQINNSCKEAVADLSSGLCHGLGCSLTGLLAQLHTGHLASQLVQVVLSVVQEAVNDLVALTGPFRPLLLGQQLLVGLPVMRL